MSRVVALALAAIDRGLPPLQLGPDDYVEIEQEEMDDIDD